MSKDFLNYHQQGILLLVAAALILVSIPFIDGKSIGVLIIVLLGIYNLVFR